MLYLGFQDVPNGSRRVSDDMVELSELVVSLKTDGILSQRVTR